MTQSPCVFVTPSPARGGGRGHLALRAKGRHALARAGWGGSLLSQAAAPIAVTIDLKDRRQKIQHFGASDCWSVQYVGNWPSAKVEAMADLLFSRELDGQNNPRGIGLSPSSAV